MSVEEEIFMFEDGDGDMLHRALCKALGISPGHGSKSQVAEALDVRSQRYSRIIAKSVCALEPAARLCSPAGVRMVMHKGVVYFYPPGVVPPEELIYGEADEEVAA